MRLTTDPVMGSTITGHSLAYPFPPHSGSVQVPSATPWALKEQEVYGSAQAL